jgi:hypothetical protein
MPAARQASTQPARGALAERAVGAQHRQPRRAHIAMAPVQKCSSPRGGRRTSTMRAPLAARGGRDVLVVAEEGVQARSPARFRAGRVEQERVELGRQHAAGSRDADHTASGAPAEAIAPRAA